MLVLRLLACAWLAVLIASSCAPRASAAEGADQLIVRFADDARAADRAAAREDANVQHDERLPLPGTEVAVVEPGTSVREAVAALERSDDVVYAEPDQPRRATLVPNDPLFSAEWGLRSTGQAVGGRRGAAGADIGAPQAWNATTGSPDVEVAVVDSGVQLDHRDLSPNIATNPGEVAGNGVDDDRNGFIDDVHGWDFVARDAQPLDENGHGTHVAGTIGARGNDGYGVTGVAWQTGLLPVRVLGADGSGRVSDVIAAYGYAARQGARIINLSLGGGGYSRAERDALAAIPGVLVVAAAGNDGANVDTGDAYPCEYDLPNVVCVAASDRDDALAAFSNYGAAGVDLAAPGVDIASTYPTGTHVLLDGTSMATPAVSGAAALALAVRPDLTAARLRQLLLDTTDPIPALSGKVATGGRLDAAALVGAVGGATAGTPDAAEPASDGSAEAPAPPADPDPEPAPEVPRAPVLPSTGTTAPSAAAPNRAPAPARDTLAPGTSIRAARTARRGQIRATASCSEACTLRVELRRGGRTLARTTIRLTRAGRRTLTLRTSRTGRAELRATASDAAGNRRTVTRRIALRR